MLGMRSQPLRSSRKRFSFSAIYVSNCVIIEMSFLEDMYYPSRGEDDCPEMLKGKSKCGASWQVSLPGRTTFRPTCCYDQGLLRQCQFCLYFDRPLSLPSLAHCDIR